MWPFLHILVLLAQKGTSHLYSEHLSVEDIRTTRYDWSIHCCCFLFMIHAINVHKVCLCLLEYEWLCHTGLKQFCCVSFKKKLPCCCLMRRVWFCCCYCNLYNKICLLAFIFVIIHQTITFFVWSKIHILMGSSPDPRAWSGMLLVQQLCGLASPCNPKGLLFVEGAAWFCVDTGGRF